MASSDSGGVKVISIGGRVTDVRERLIGMTDEERAWRAKYLKSQILAPEEPITTKEYYKNLYNPIRRFYRAPLNQVESLLTPLMGSTRALVTRHVIANLLMSIVAVYGGWYYMKYNTATWMRQSGWRIIKTPPAQIPGAKNYQGLIKPKQFATSGFENSPI
ncbi:uncharacterized protein LOC143221367 [Lasioglossum baleicum]|uniref:uncharacterized protein LOC143221367 n=1 Tax=Lasioglossum baleicum TaxID=434251 RepID=UPI003FCDCE1B